MVKKKARIRAAREIRKLVKCNLPDSIKIVKDLEKGIIFNNVTEKFLYDSYPDNVGWHYTPKKVYFQCKEIVKKYLKEV